ncbi:Fer-1-like protein 4, partial [Varanus komodoensis]
MDSEQGFHEPDKETAAVSTDCLRESNVSGFGVTEYLVLAHFLQTCYYWMLCDLRVGSRQPNLLGVAPGQFCAKPSPENIMALSVSVKRVTQLPGSGERQVHVSFRGFTQKTKKIHCGQEAVFGE